MAAREAMISPADTGCSVSSGSTSATDSPYFMMTGADLHYDQHSSEEELEVINSTPKETFRKYTSGTASRAGTRGVSRLGRAASAGSLSSLSSSSAEKRKWAQTQETAACPASDPDHPDRLASPFTASLSVAENDENAASNKPPTSSDEDALPAPVRFRTSPPLEALKPRRGHRGLPPLAALGGRACSCCAATHAASAHADHLFHYDVSPRKRSRHSSRRHMQRPCLDFDKMQQLKVHAVTAWRHGGTEHGGELSVFCW